VKSLGNKKREALIQFNRDNIIKAARMLFEEKGILATTVDDIAKEADYSKSTLYVYFKSKDEILNTILYEQMLMLKEILDKCINNFSDFTSCYFSICGELVKYQEKYPIFYNEMLGEIKITQKDMEERNTLYDIYQIGEKINDIVEALLQKGIENGFIRADIAMIPTVLYLWSGISETIRFANRKQEYLNMRLKMNKKDYMEYGFRMLLKSITR
jgi:AcrR family transcriptional regulator